jgi:hypothetical protein
MIMLLVFVHNVALHQECNRNTEFGKLGKFSFAGTKKNVGKRQFGWNRD